MKDKIISLLIDCDKMNEGVCSSPQMAPSCSIEIIAQYMANHLQNRYICNVCKRNSSRN